MITLLSLKALCKGQRAIKPIAVVQLGLAINFLLPILSALISGTTRGTSLSYLKADELSITTAPSSPSQIALACSREKSPDTARNTTSHSRAALTSNRSTLISPNLPASLVVPAERSDPKIRSFDTSNEELLRQPRISFPTAPVAPTIPTEYDMFSSDADLLDMVTTFAKERLAGVEKDRDLALDLATKELEGEGLNPKADETEETATRNVAAELNFILYFKAKRLMS